MKVKKCWYHLLYADVISFSITRKCQKIRKIDENFGKENLHIFWMTGGLSMKFSGKVWLMTILKVTKKQGFTLSPKNAFLEKPRGEVKLTPEAFLGIPTHVLFCEFCKIFTNTFFTEYLRMTASRYLLQNTGKHQYNSFL